MISDLHIQTALRGQVTFFKKAYFTPPFKVANITEDKQSHRLHLMIMNSSPGVLDEDKYQMKIELSEKCSLQLHTQSYQRLFAMKKNASQTMEVQQAPSSSFCFLPHPVVPHETSDFSSKNKIFLTDDCSLIWGEVLTCGRKLSGEVFMFSKYKSLTEIFINDKLVIRENLLIQPSFISVTAIGQMEGYTHQATLICLDEKMQIKNLIKKINDYLSVHTQMAFGITTAPVNGFIVRLLGEKAEQLYDCLKWISLQVQQTNKQKSKVNNAVAIVDL